MNNKHETESSWSIMMTSDPQSPIRQFKLSKLFTFVILLFFLMTLMTMWYFYQSTQFLMVEKEKLYVEMEDKDKEIQQAKEGPIFIEGGEA